MPEPPSTPRPESADHGAALTPEPLLVTQTPEQVVVNAQAEPSDDSPTIITRTPHRAGRSEDGFASALRGRQLAHYELLEPIGVGGMAAVLRARDTQLDRIVALKILPPDMATDPETVRRFQQEARAAARLDHENVARVFFCGEDQGLNFISFEFVEGDNLRTILERRGRLPVAEAVHYVLQVAVGLAHAASRGVVHRDIKPSNIIITPAGRAKLVDMGLARSLDPHADAALTQSGVTLGTFDYISPEQALEPREADVRSDIYSLGCTFYHLLTGQAPVPEGTAAKKLHHHQHVAPIDPRQLNPEIPDEVAAVLARMMAKDPADRYQRPEHLVHHLVHVARQLGAAADVPEAMAVPEAPLPGPPRLRPVLLGLAAVVLVLLVALHTMSPDGDRRPASPALANAQGSPVPSHVTNTDRATTLPTRPPITTATKPPPAPQVIEVYKQSELTDALRQSVPGRRLEIRIAKDIDLEPPRNAMGGGDEATALLWQASTSNRELVIRPAPNMLHRPTLHWVYDPNSLAQRWVALVVDGGAVKIEGLRFEVDLKGASPSRIKMTAIRLIRGRLELQDCEFTQNGLASTDSQLPTGDASPVSVAVNAPVRSTAFLSCDGCCFTSHDLSATATNIGWPTSQEAVQLSGAAHGVFTNCAFGPHATLFHLAADSNTADVRLQYCSALLTNGVAFQVDGGASCPIRVQHCLFANPLPNAKALAEATTTLVRTTRRGHTEPIYSGSDNGYFHIGVFCQQTADNDLPVTSWDDFRGQFTKDDGSDTSRILDTAPWDDQDPLKDLQQGRLADAFRLDTHQADLRGQAPAGSPKRMIGVERCARGKLYPMSLPSLVDPAMANQHILTVNPVATADSTHGVYQTINAAVLGAKPGDVIEIQSDDRLKVDPIVLFKADCNLTIRPASRYHPVLLLSDAPTDTPSLFKIFDGKLRLEQLEFQFKPELKYREPPAVVAIAGNGQCTFHQCVLTLDAANVPGSDRDSIRLAAVRLGVPQPMVKMNGSPMTPAVAVPSQPEIHFENCFVRGVGDLVAVAASRPFSFEGDNSLVVLDGSVVTVGAGASARDVGLMSPASITLKRVSAYLSDSLIRLQTNREATDLVKMNVSASDCVFTAAAEGKALVYFDGELNDPQKFTRVVQWNADADGRNICSRFDYMFYQQMPPTSVGMSLSPVGIQKWIDDNRDVGQWFNESDRIIGPAQDDDAFAAVRPSEFRIRKASMRKDYGADLATLAQPKSDTHSDSPTTDVGD